MNRPIWKQPAILAVLLGVGALVLSSHSARAQGDPAGLNASPTFAPDGASFGASPTFAPDGASFGASPTFSGGFPGMGYGGAGMALGTGAGLGGWGTGYSYGPMTGYGFGGFGFPNYGFGYPGYGYNFGMSYPYGYYGVGTGYMGYGYPAGYGYGVPGLWQAEMQAEQTAQSSVAGGWASLALQQIALRRQREALDSMRANLAQIAEQEDAEEGAPAPAPAPEPLISQTGQILWPAETPTGPELDPRREAAETAIRSALRDYHQRGRASVRRVIAARDALESFARPALERLRDQNQNTDDLASFGRFVQRLDYGLRSLAEAEPGRQANAARPNPAPASEPPQAAPSEAQRPALPTDEPPKSGGDVLKNSILRDRESGPPR